MIHDRAPFTNAILEMLRSGTGKLIGDHKAPPRLESMTDDDYNPYAILYSIPGTTFSGSLADQHEDADLVFQVTSVGLVREQAEWMADRVRQVWCARTVGGGFQVPIESPVGWAVAGRIVLDGFVGGVDREADPPHEVWSVPERFVLQVTPIFQGV